MTTERLVLLFAAAGVLAACQQAPTAPPAPESGRVVAPPPAPAPPVISEPPSAPSAPVGPAAQQQALRIAKETVALLELGKEDQARAELQRALAIDPNNPLALNLMRQITADPVAVLGRESYPYVVRPNETLSAIAGRVLNDVYGFYILARYNEITVPKQLASGQTLRLPGKAPRITPPPQGPAPGPAGFSSTKGVTLPGANEQPVGSPPSPGAPTPPAPPSLALVAFSAGEAAERRGDLDRALDQYLVAAGLQHPGAAGKAQQVRKELVRRHSTDARKAMANQDLDGAVQAWDRVLALEPGEDTAALERKRALALRKRLQDLPTADKSKKP